jgi:hypothetical protein
VVQKTVDSNARTVRVSFPLEAASDTVTSVGKQGPVGDDSRETAGILRPDRSGLRMTVGVFPEQFLPSAES